MLISLARSKFICSKPIHTRWSTYWPAEGCTLFTCQPTCHLQLGAACIICMQMSFGTFSCPHPFPFPYFCNAFFFFLQFILRFARLCCGLHLALSHSNGGLIKHKPKSSDDDSCNCRWHFTLGQYARHAECRREREERGEGWAAHSKWLWAWVLSPARCFYEKFLSDKFFFFLSFSPFCCWICRCLLPLFIGQLHSQMCT